MPLIHKKSPAAFKKNIKAEIHAGKPQKQAVAIAYSVKRKAEHHKNGHGGEIEECETCLADGGEVKGVHEPVDKEFTREESKKYPHAAIGARQSMAGRELEHNGDVEKAKSEHHRVLGELRSMPKPKIQGLAHGGEVNEVENAEELDHDGDHDVDHEIHDMLGKELMESIHSKDHKKVMSSIEACVLQCLNKNRG